MDTELFMECEEEELEPWQQVDDGVDEDDNEDDNVDACEAATSPSSSSLKLRAPPLPPSCATPQLSQAPPFILTQTSGGAHLLLSTQVLPLPSPGPSLNVKLPPKPLPVVRPAVGVSFDVPRDHALSGAPAQPSLHANSGHQASGLPSYSSVTPTKVVLSVDEFYYGTAGGGEQPLRRKFQQPLASSGAAFSCSICKRALSDNLRLVQHTLQHSPLIRGGDDRKMCAFCFRQFSSAAHLHDHREQVHGPAPSSCTCRICEWAFEDEPAFLNHMKANHKPGEMPYVCQVCLYRSSFYSDVLQHFAGFHRDSRYLLCVFCLKVSRNVACYQKHVLRHQVSQAFHCSRCRLQFAFLADKKRHKLERHRSVRRHAKLEGLPLGSKVTIRMYGKKRVPMASVGGGARLLQDPSCLIQPIKIKTERQKDCDPGDPPPDKPPPSDTPSSPAGGRLWCLECGGDVGDMAAHYPTHVRCLFCAFGSCCSRAYAAHMIHHHVPRTRTKGKLVPPHRRPPPCPFFLLCCRCDFASVSGDEMAKHLLTNPEHDSATCRSREHMEPDIQLRWAQETPCEPEGEEPRGERDWRRVDSWSAPEDDGPDAPPVIAGFSQSCGPQKPVLKNGDALDFFNLLFPTTLVELIAAETNAHARNRRHLGSGCRDWFPVTPQEIKAFLGLCILMGVENFPEQSQYWSWNERDIGSTFQRAMSPQRFTQVASNICMGSFGADEFCGRNGEKPLRVFRRMLELLSGAMWAAYRPNCCLSVDRALLPAPEGDPGTGGGSQGQPQVWLLCDSKSGYCHRFFIQTGQKAGRDVVRELVRGLEEKHHQIYLASSLASVPLLQTLLERGIYASSSFPPPSVILPAGLWQDGRLDKPGDFLQRRLGPLLATRWRDTKEMGCLSTNAPAGRADTVWRRSQNKAGGLEPMERPMAFRLLQENMRGVDICKQLLACNPLGGILQDRHWRALFWFLVNLSVVNAFIVLRESRKDNPPAWVRDGLFAQVNFRRRLGVQLVECAHKPTADHNANGDGGGGPGKTKAERGIRHRAGEIGGPPSGRCRRCCGNRDGTWGCVTCGVGLCKEPRCFWEFHGQSPLNRGPTQVGFIHKVHRGDGGKVEPKKVQDHLAPLEDLDFSEDEDADTPEEIGGIKEEAPSPPPSPNVSSQSAAPKERVDFLSAHQLRVTLLALCAGLRQASMVFSTEPRLIRLWLKEARKHLKQTRREEAGARVAADGEAHLVAWVLSQREQQLSVSESVFFHKAAALNKNGALGDAFRISYDWAVLFMLRYRLGPAPADGRRAPVRHLPPALQANVQSFKEFVHRVVRRHHLSHGSLAAVDELCYFVDPRSFQDRRTRAQALQFTGSVPLVAVCLSALADGTMLPALVLTNRQPADEAALPDFVVLEVTSQNPSANEAFKRWTQRIWLPYLSGPLPHGKSMLLLDQHQDHAADVSLGSLSGSGTLPAVIPEGCSFLLQPLDLCVKPALERFVRARWNAFSADCQKEPDEAAAPPPGRLQDTAAQMLIRWTVQALAHLKDWRQAWRSSFQMTGVLLRTDPGQEGPQLEDERQNLLEELEKILMPPEDRLDLPEVEDDEDFEDNSEEDSEDDQTSAEKGQENKMVEEEEAVADTKMKRQEEREENEEMDIEEKEQEPGEDTKMKRQEEREEKDEMDVEEEEEEELEPGEGTKMEQGECLLTMEEDSEEEKKENEDQNEAAKERRETRIMIGEEVGDEWKITMKAKTETRTEAAQTDQDEHQQTDRS
ncbi:pogo transposable element with ZNF domain isoform X2 [Festucalex cinctus]